MYVHTHTHISFFRFFPIIGYYKIVNIARSLLFINFTYNSVYLLISNSKFIPLPPRDFCFCCSCSVAHSCLNLCGPRDCSTPGFPVLHSVLELLEHMSIESVMPFNVVILFSSCLLSFQASGSFPMSWLFTSGGQSTGTSASVLPMNIQVDFLWD